MNSTFLNRVRRLAVWAGGALVAVGLAAWPLWSQIPAPPKVEVPKAPDVKVPDVDPQAPAVPKVPDLKPDNPELPAPPKTPDVKPGDVPAVDPKLPRIDPNVDPKLPRVDPNVDPKLPRVDPNVDPKVRPGADVHAGANVHAGAYFNPATIRSADVGLWFNTNANNGLVIHSIAGRGAIANLGFREGDRIVSVNGQRVIREADFISYLFANNLRTQRVPVLVMRGGQQTTIYVQPSVLVDDYTTAQTQTDAVEQFGVILDDRYTDQLVVWRVIPRSPAYYAGIYPGDVLVSLRGARLTSPAQFTTTIQGINTAGVIPVQVMRNRQARTLEVDYAPGATRRTALRPNIDLRDNINDVDRANPRREDRIEDRQDRREDVREGRVPDNDPNTPAVERSTNQPQPTYSSQPRRRWFRNR